MCAYKDCIISTNEALHKCKDGDNCYYENCASILNCLNLSSKDGECSLTCLVCVARVSLRRKSTCDNNNNNNNPNNLLVDTEAKSWQTDTNL